MPMRNFSTYVPLALSIKSTHTATGTTSAAVTFTVGAGNSLVVCMAGLTTAGQTAPRVADGVNTYSTLDASGPSGLICGVSYSMAVAGGSLTITADNAAAAATHMGIFVYELTGEGVWALDKSTSDNNTTGTTFLGSGLLSGLATSNDFVCSACSFENSGTLTQAGSYTLDASANLGTGSNWGVEHILLSGSTSTTPSFSSSGSSGHWSAGGRAFKFTPTTETAPNFLIIGS